MKNRNFKYLLIAISITVITVLFSFAVISQEIPAIDQTIHETVSGWGSPALHNIMFVITFLVDTKTAFVLTVITIIYLLTKYKKALYLNFLLCMSMGGGVVITYFIKTGVGRERPGEIAHMNIWGLFTERVSYSFPSGHSIKALLLFGFIIYFIYTEMKDRKLRGWIIFFLAALILAIGAGQVILNRHYATDIVGGYLVGVAWFYFCLATARPIYDYICKYVTFLEPSHTRQQHVQV